MTGDAFAALWEIGTRIQAEETDHDAVLRLIVEHARDLLGSDVAWLALVDTEEPDGPDDPDRGDPRLRIRVAAGARNPRFLDQHVAVGTGIGGVALLHGSTVVVPDYAVHIQDTPDFVRRAVLEEGIVTVMCGPMLRAGAMIGALYVGNRRPSRFADPAPALMSALAAQAAVAVVNAGLYRRLAEQNRLLAETWAIHRELTDVALAGGGVAQVGRTLARLLDAAVVVEQEVLPPFRAEHGEPGGGAPVRLPVVAGGDRLGTLQVTAAGPLSAVQRTAAEQAATVLALELLRLREARDTEWRLRGELLDELLDRDERGEPAAGLLARAHRLGVDLAADRSMVAVGAPDDVDRQALLATVRAVVAGFPAGAPVPVALRGEVVALAVPADAGASVGDLALAVRAAATRAGTAVTVGVSAPRTGTAAGWREAQACERLARRRGGAVVRLADLGPLRFLLDAPDLSAAGATVRDVLGPLAAHDRARRARLLPTVRAYVFSDGHQAATAEALFLHVSTVKYRLARAAAVLGRPLAEPAHRFELRLAFELLDVLEVLGGDPLGTGRPPSTAPGRP